MASSSSFLTSTTTPQPQGRYEYDVFLSFRGEDTRDNFVSHLYDALSRKQILTFKDDKELRRGEEISPSLLNAIEKSKISVIIFSENYASSKWCLEELAKILQCKEMNGLMVIPVFYRVDPSTVRKQTGSFADALAEHVKEKVDVDKVQNWKVALTEAANLSGWDSLVTRPETELINKLTEDILKKLNRMSQIILPKGLVGIESRIKEVESLLCMGSVNVRSVGIWGMGGIGKTTIDEAVFCCICPQFEGFHFIENVREELKRVGIDSLWNKLLSELLGEENLNMGTLSLRFTFVKERLHRKKVLIVFDDVDDSIIEPLKGLLVEKYDFFGFGSRILITSRDKQVLEILRVDEVYEVNGLNYEEAHKLFYFNAFKRKDHTNYQWHWSNKVVNYANGNPLAIKVLGSALLSKSKEVWDNALEKLEKTPKSGIMNVLRISYDGLSSKERALFLDIACFFRGENRNYATKILESYHFCVHVSIDNLIDKSLITISHYNNLEMHDLLQEMGKEIVNEECINNPGKRSRLWDSKDVNDVLTQKKGTELVEGIYLDLSKSREMHLESDAFKGMTCLRLLKFYNSNWHTNFKRKVHLPRDGLRYFSKELRYFHWEAFPSKSLPLNFCAENLVQLILPESKVKQLWSGVQNVVNLRKIDLSQSKYLTEIPNLSKAKNIERINLWGCDSLVKLTSSIRYLDKLEILNLRDCENLRSVPRRIGSKFLKLLNLGSCPHVKKCPRISSENVEELYLEETANKELPKSIHKFKALRFLSLCGSNVIKFPELSSSRNLKILTLTESAIEEVPPSIGFLTRLIWLDMSHNKKLLRLPNSICKLKSLQSLYLHDCPKLESFPEIFEPMESLVYLYLQNCPNLEIPSDLFRWTTSLSFLDLSRNNLERLPASIVLVNTLKKLYLSNCKRLLSLPQLPVSLTDLVANGCESLETISIEHLPSKRLELMNCMRLDEETRSKITSLFHSPPPPFFFGHVILPGSDIPEWFSYQRTDSSLTIHLLDCHRVVDVAFCIVFAMRKPSRSSRFKFRCRFKDNYGERCVYLDPFVRVGDGLPLQNSDHMLLGYARYYNQATLKFNFGVTEHINVKKCGVHLLYDKNSCGDSDDEDYWESKSEDTDPEEDNWESMREDTDPEEDNWESMKDDNNLKRRFDDHCPNDPEASGSSGSGRSDDKPNKRIKLLQD